nr:PREDICTED: actin cytoskeleton-regulatory complex protein pan1-like [Megachile rotundata]
MAAGDGTDSDASSASRKRKKGGRSATTNEVVDMVAAKKRLFKVEAEVMKVGAAEAVLAADGPARPPSRSSIPLPDEMVLAREYRAMSTAAIIARVNEHMEQVERVATTSKNQNGRFVRALRLASQETRVAEAELATQSATSATNPLVAEAELATRSATSATKVLEEQNRILRKNLEEMGEDLRRLRQEMQAQRCEVATPPANSAPARALPPRPARAPPSAPLAAVTTLWANALSSDQLLQQITQQITQLIDQRFAAMRAEMLPLTAPQRQRKPPQPQNVPQQPGTPTVPTPTSGGTGAVRKRRQKRLTAPPTSSEWLTPSPAATTTRTRQKIAAAAAPPPAQLTTPTATPTRLWSTVVWRKERRRPAAAAVSESAPKASRLAPVRGSANAQRGPAGAKTLPLRPLRTAAV